LAIFQKKKYSNKNQKCMTDNDLNFVPKLHDFPKALNIGTIYIGLLANAETNTLKLNVLACIIFPLCNSDLRDV
jgi:hypothetical protein